MLNFRFTKVRTIQFALFDGQLLGNEALTSVLSFSVEEESNCIVASPRFTLEQNGNPLATIQISCHFEIKEEDFNKSIKVSKTSRVIPKDFAWHIMVLTIGTTRGILVEKLVDTALENFILPMIDITEIIKSDITLEVATTPSNLSTPLIAERE